MVVDMVSTDFAVDSVVDSAADIVGIVADIVGLVADIVALAGHRVDHSVDFDNSLDIAVLLNNLVADTVVIDLIGFDLDLFRFDLNHP